MSSHRSRKAKVSLRHQSAALIFVVIFLLVQAAAFNTGENLLYLIASSVASFLLVGLIVTRSSLRGLRARRNVPATVHRSEPFGVDVVLRNDRRLMPSVSLSIGEDGDEAGLRAYVPRVPAGGSATVRVEHVLSRRGAHALPDLTISSGFPLGLFRSRLVYCDGEEVLVYPRVYSIRREVIEHIDDSGDRARPLDLSGDEFFALREYVPGDDIRYICWRVSARLGELIVRELEPSTARSIVVVLDPRGVPDTAEREEQFEESVDLAASLAMTLLDRQYGVAVVTPDASVGLGSGNSQATKILELLARVEPMPYSACGDDWFLASGDLAGAAKIFVATDPAQWGGPVYGRGVRVLDPREVAHA